MLFPNCGTKSPERSSPASSPGKLFSAKENCDETRRNVRIKRERENRGGTLRNDCVAPENITDVRTVGNAFEEIISAPFEVRFYVFFSVEGS